MFLAVLQVCLGMAAAGLLLTVVSLPGFRDSTGFPTAVACLGMAAALALGILAALARTRLRATGAWLAATMLGQAATLQLIDAGPAVHYQHYPVALSALSAVDLLCVALLALQASLVWAALWPRRAAIGQWLRSELGLYGCLGVGAVFAATAAFPSRDLGAFAVELIVAIALRSIALASCVALILSVPPSMREALSARVGRLLGGSGDETTGKPRSDRALVWLCASFVALVSALLSVTTYERHPHVPDELAYLMHAEYFAEGALGRPVPAVPEAFQVYLWPCDEERCYSPVPPGWPAMLALGVLLGVPWAVNPALGALALLLTYPLLCRLYDRRTARMGVLLLAASPWYLLVSMSFMTHAFSLCCALAAALCVAHMHGSKSGARPLVALAGGVALGLVSLTRPLEGAIAAGVLGPAALLLRGRRFRFAPVGLLVLGSIAVAALVLPYNQELTGDPLRFPIMSYTDAELGPGVNALGFGPDRGTHWGGMDPFPGHGLADVLVNGALNLTAIDVELFGWAFGSLLPLVVLVALGRLRRNDFWLLAFAASAAAWHSLYWYSGGPDFGARYWYLAVVPVVALCARGVLELADRFSAGEARNGSLVIAAALTLSVISLVNFVPWRAVDKYHHYRGMRADMRPLLASRDFGNALLLVRGERHPDYASARLYSAADASSGRPLIARDLNAAVRAQLLAAYPERQVWLVDGPTITGSGYRVHEQDSRALGRVGRPMTPSPK